MYKKKKKKKKYWLLNFFFSELPVPVFAFEIYTFKRNLVDKNQHDIEIYYIILSLLQAISWLTSYTN